MAGGTSHRKVADRSPGPRAQGRRTGTRVRQQLLVSQDQGKGKEPPAKVRGDKGFSRPRPVQGIGCKPLPDRTNLGISSLMQLGQV